MTRRTFVDRSCGAIAVALLGQTTLAGCDSTVAVPPAGVHREGNTLYVDLAQQSALTQADGHLWIESEDVIIIHDDVVGYRAFSSVCPHERKDVTQFDGEELRCPSHGWTFDLDGAPTGRSSRPIARFGVLEIGGELQVQL